MSDLLIEHAEAILLAASKAQGTRRERARNRSVLAACADLLNAAHLIRGEDPRRVADRLTVMQQKAILGSPDVHWVEGGHPATIRVLWEKGIVDRRFLPACLTSLGVAVRAILEGQNKGQSDEQ